MTARGSFSREVVGSFLYRCRTWARRTRNGLVASAVLLLGCTTEEAADEPPKSPPVTSEPQEGVAEDDQPEGSLQEGAAVPADLPQLVFLARGNEPFWNVRIFPDRLRYEALGEDPVEFTDPENLSDPGTGTWAWSAEGDAGVAISITIERRTCSDTMADVSYEYAASVSVSDRLLQGCAFKGGAGG